MAALARSTQVRTAQVPDAGQASETSARVPQVCTGSLCTEVNSFAATVTDFRTSTVSGIKVITAAIRFQNKLARPLILGYLSGSGTATDDQGNRYIATPESIRGIGAISNGQVDPKFMLRPGESADTRFEMVWRWSGREVFGLNFEMDLTVREVLPLASRQLRLGQEHPLRFRGLTNAVSSAAPPTSTGELPVVTGVPVSGGVSPAPAPGPDPCIGVPRCFNAGPFLAEVQQINSSMYGGRHHVLRFNVRFRNLTSNSLILASTYNSLVATDNVGNRYGITPQAVNGMGVVVASKADPQFVLNPGQTRNASFEVYRRNSGNPTGTSYTFDVSLEQLEILASQQIRSTRQFALNFPNLMVSPIGVAAQQAAPASPESLSETGKKIVDIFRKKK